VIPQLSFLLSDTRRCPMKYTTIYADPPWPQGGGGVKGAKNYYTVMSFDRIKLMGDWIDQISAPDSHLYMWVVANYLQEGLDTMKAWGYRYVTNLVWAKDKIGLGFYYRTKHEILIFGTKGKHIPPLTLATYPSVVQAPRGRHSAKPDDFYKVIEGVSPGPYLELFARQKYEGWHSWGNEVECDVHEDFGFWQPSLALAA